MAALITPVGRRSGKPLTPGRLREFVHYDPETGIFIRRRKWGEIAPAGKQIGGLNAAGYIVFAVDGVSDYAHRFAWAYMAGEWPAERVDHRDLDKANNRWANLRLASPSQNAVNVRTRRNNASGHKGVIATRNGTWRAFIVRGGKQLHIGCFKTKFEAITAYRAKATEIYGEYVCFSPTGSKS